MNKRRQPVDDLVFIPCPPPISRSSLLSHIFSFSNLHLFIVSLPPQRESAFFLSKSVSSFQCSLFLCCPTLKHKTSVHRKQPFVSAQSLDFCPPLLQQQNEDKQRMILVLACSARIKRLFLSQGEREM